MMIFFLAGCEAITDGVCATVYLPDSIIISLAFAVVTALFAYKVASELWSWIPFIG